MEHAAQAAKHSSHVSPSAPVDEFSNNKFSPVTLRLCWVAFISLHTFCFLYFAVMAVCYWCLPDSTFGRWLYFYDLGLDPENDCVIAIVHGGIAGIHFYFLLWMIGWSVKEHGFVFAVYDIFAPQSKGTTRAEQCYHRVANAYRSFVAKIGLVGVDGPYFDLVLLCREIVETALQTHQGYRMSLLLPRTQLNRGYVGLLVLNCWATTLVHSTFHESSIKRRFYAIMCDCALDLVTSVGISVTLIAIYFPDFDFEIKDFPVHKWYEDVWVMQLISEFQILLVTWWGDLAMRMVFALSMISNMNNMKKILSTRVAPEKRNSTINYRRVAVIPCQPSATGLPGRLRSKLRMLEPRLTKLIFFVWGVVILAFHLYAESISSLPQCKIGTEMEVVGQWSSFNPKATAGVTVRHCPNLQFPSIFAQFSRLKMLKVYNSTIQSWNKSAAISQSSHPNLIMLFFVRVNMPNGQLPMGLQADEFPKTLMDIEFCLTNLHTLPDDIDKKWPQLASIYIEASNFTEVPPALARLAPYDLSLAGNPIQSISAKLFEGKLAFLHIGATLISELPENVTKVSSLEQIRVDNTNVSFFWAWIDPVVVNAGSVLSDAPATIVASNTPYCNDIQRIYEGNQIRFSTPQHHSQSILLSDASMQNWPTLKQAVSCNEWPRILYPIEFEDNYNGIKTA